MTLCGTIAGRLVAYGCAAWLVVFGFVLASDASAQDRQEEREPSARKKAARSKAKAAKKDKSEKKDEGRASRGPEETLLVPAASTDEATSKGKADAARASANASDADVRKEGDTEVKVMEFSGLDIEGQLKTPQMLYFLNRLRAEFGRPDLSHRSFIPELQRGASEKAF